MGARSRFDRWIPFEDGSSAIQVRYCPRSERATVLAASVTTTVALLGDRAVALAVAFLVVDLMLVMTPGADWAYAITAGVRDGRLVPAVAGLAGGYVVQAVLVVAGVGAVLPRARARCHSTTDRSCGSATPTGRSFARPDTPPATCRCGSPTGGY